MEEVAVEENKKVESDDDEVPELEEQEAEPVAETPSVSYVRSICFLWQDFGD